MGLKVSSMLLKDYTLRLGNVTVEALANSVVNFLFFSLVCISAVTKDFQGQLFQLHQPFLSELH